jgi:hypothetical protein
MRSCDISHDEVPVDTDEGFGIHQFQEAQPRVEGKFPAITVLMGATNPDSVPEED